jgi:hypothetical protein
VAGQERRACSLRVETDCAVDGGEEG